MTVGAPDPGPVTAYLLAGLRQRLEQHGCVLLVNPDGRLLGPAHTLTGTVGAVVSAQGSSLAIKREAETTFSALRGPGPYALHASLLIVVPHRPARPSEDPYLEYAEAGTQWAIDLPALTVEALAGRLSRAEVLETFAATPALTLAQADELGRASAVQTHIFQPLYGVTDPDVILERFAHDPVADATVPLAPLAGLAQARVGLTLDTSAVGAARRSLWTHLFQAALLTTPAAEGASLPLEVTRARALLTRLRSAVPDSFAAWAERVQDTFKPYTLTSADPVWLPGQDDLRQLNVVSVLKAGETSATLAAVQPDDFWAQRGVRAVAWSALRLAQAVMDDVLHLRARVHEPLPRLLAHYQDCWYRIDGTVRQLETLVDVPDLVRPAVDYVRHQARLAVEELATATLARYHTEGIDLPLPAQTRTFADTVAPHLRAGTVAYLLIDALRYDLGKDLERLLNAPALALNVHLEARSATLPTITPFGMAALLPGAEAGLGITASGDPTLGDKVLKDAAARKKYLTEALPQAFPLDSTLERLPTEAALRARLQAGTRLIVVRDSQLDSFGEVDAAPAVATFGLVLDAIVTATRTLLNAGIDQVIIATDHGFLLLPGDSANKVDPPGTPSVLLKRRVWLGELPVHGGPAGSLAVPLPDAHLSAPTGQTWHLLFPPGRALFVTPGGNSNYTHGGPTLQERVVPLLTVTRHPDTAPVTEAPRRRKEPLPELHADFAPVTMGTFRGVTLRRTDLLGGPMTVRVDLIDEPGTPTPQHGTLISPPNAGSDVTLDAQPAELMFTVPHPGTWTLQVQDAQGRTLLSVTEPTSTPASVPTLPSAWQTPAGAPDPSPALLPLLSALVTQRDLGADDIDRLARQHALSKRDRRAFDAYLDELALTHPTLIVRDSTVTPHRYRLEGHL